MVDTPVVDAALDEQFTQDPHGVLAQMRAEQPVRRMVMARGVPVWVISRYADARAALADPRLAKGAQRTSELFRRNTSEETNVPFSNSLYANLLNTDPPDHTRLRNLVSKAFTVRRVEALRPRIEEITDALLAEMAGHDEVDLLDAFAFPLPITVICELLGVPECDRGDFRSWSSVVVSSTSKNGDITKVMEAVTDYFVKLIAVKRSTPSDDLLGALILASDNDDRLDEVELLSMVFLLLVAGHETTVNLIGNGVFALLRNPGQLAALRDDPSLLPSAVEEFLRYDGPVNLATLRHTLEPVRVGEVEIPADELVLVSLSSGNRDDERFADPDSLDITRQTGGHLAFGHGIHFCVGAPLARLEGVIAIGRLLAAFPNLALAAQATELRWRESTLIRGLETLPVRLN